MAKSICECEKKIVASEDDLHARGDVKVRRYCDDCIADVDAYRDAVKSAEAEVAQIWNEKRAALEAEYAPKLKGGKLPEL